MSVRARPRRSVLYVPGANSRALEKARSLPADGLILDLEDSVSPHAKDIARENAIAASGNYGQREVLIRTNALETPWGHNDITAIARSAAHGIVLPKVESADAVRRAEIALDAAGASSEMLIWCMIETPLGVLDAKHIASASSRLGGLIVGSSDLTQDLHALHTPDRLPILSALSMTVMAARAYGLAVLDGVHLDLADETGFERACRQGRELGFDGKTLIHPKMIAPANTAFGPSEADVSYARHVVSAHDEALAQGKGITVLEGKLIEALHVEEAQRILALAEAIARMTS